MLTTDGNKEISKNECIQKASVGDVVSKVTPTLIQMQ